MKLESVIAEVRAEIDKLRNPPPHVCATFCYCGSRLTTRAESDLAELRRKAAESDRFKARLRELLEG